MKENQEKAVDRFKIATYNVNSIRSRLPIVLSWLEENRPNVFCMQETKVADDRFPAGAFSDIGYSIVFRGNKQYNGVAVASLGDPENVLLGLEAGGEEADEDRLIAVRHSGIWVINTYVPQGRGKENPQFAYKLRWYDRFRSFLERNWSPDDSLIWCGDLNVAPESIDVHDPKRLLGHVCFTPEVWDAFARVKSWGLEDLFRKFHPGEPQSYTFFDYRVPGAVERKLGWRIDHILSTPGLAQRCSGCAIDMNSRTADKPSDHVVLFADFML
ncbi:MAG: Exodeoxyribonuclease III [Syntrophus sp. PtaU1.Bin005]|jgi:exodeoxyribonuclease-3|uniref:exodeoxyribonuclease III n=1 Tax=Syntrophus sp. (in: bacteria) TaxID=48412 RepID=UPI0009C4822F|nr:MAG: Exodeoxyribonuclease III [Syntrophus sp. PtaB.Bin138]OPY79117.1 MAG: Exodeoxyribonuclease III [Syntrophus sp. PtaU1.Bin005]